MRRSGHLPALATPSLPGLRERKKAKTRAQVSDVATRLFLERGFDAVTVAEVAVEANVSVKTVFNYFGTKEDLLFDREPEWLAAIEALTATRRAGHGLIPVLRDDVAIRWPALEFGRWDRLTDATVAQRTAFLRMVTDHPVLSARRLRFADRIREGFTRAAADDLGDPDSPEVLTAGALIATAYDAAGRELTARILSGAPADEAARRARAAGMVALAAVERAYVGTPLVDGPAR